MVKETRLYELLEVEPCANNATLKKKYRELARKYHPDRNPASEDLFKDISLAYATISDPEKRNVYDIKGEMGLKKPCCKAPAYPDKKASSLKKSSSSFQDRAEPEMTVSNGDENNDVEASGSHDRKPNNNKRKLTIGLENLDEPTPQIKKSKEEGHGHSGHDQAEHDHSGHAHNEHNDSDEEEESKEDAEEGCPCCPAIGMNPDMMQQLMWRQMQMEMEMYRTRGPGAQVNDHAGHDHSGHVHAGLDHSGHDHVRHDHSEHDHAGHDHAGHDHAGHDHAGHDHSEHDHAGHDHSGHAHNEHNDSDSDEESIDDAEEGEEGCPCCPAIGMSPDMMQQLMRRQMEMEMEMYRARGPATQAHNHAGHDHSGHAHAGHDHSGHDHVGHDHSGHDHAGHDHLRHGHAGHDNSGHDHTGHDHSGHAHAGHDHSGHAHAGHDHSGHAHHEHNDSDENGESEDDAEERGCPCCPAIGMSPDMMQKLMWMQMEMERRGARGPGAQMYGYYGPPGSS